MANNIKMYRKTATEIENTPISDGTVYFDTDNGYIYLDNGSTRKTYGRDDIVINSTDEVTEILSNLQYEDDIYAVKTYDIKNQDGIVQPQRKYVLIGGGYTHDDSINSITDIDIIREFTISQFDNLSNGDSEGFQWTTDESDIDLTTNDVNYGEGYLTEKIVDLEQGISEITFTTLSDVDIDNTSLTDGQILSYDGENWTNIDKITVDNTLTSTSENTFENKAFCDFMDNILPKVTDTAPYIYRQTPIKESFKALMHKIVGASVVWNQLAPQITSTNYVENVNASTTFSNNKVTCVCVGGTAGIYQNTNSRFSITGHKYLISIVINTEQAGSFQIGFGNIGGSKAISDTNKDMRFAIVQNATADGTALVCYKVSSSENDTFTVSKYNAVDLTAMFGTTIADYVYTLETQTAGSGIAWLQSYGFFTEDYYAYKQNKLESGCVSAKKIVGKNLVFSKIEHCNISNGGLLQSYSSTQYDMHIAKVRANTTYTLKTNDNTFVGGFFTSIPEVGSTTYNEQRVVSTTTFTAPIDGYVAFRSEYGYSTAQLEFGSTATSYEPYTETTYPISPITLRGLFKLSTDKLTVDGDEYNADGSVTRKIGVVDFETVTLYDQSGSSTETEDCYRIVPPNCDLTATKTAITNIIGNYLQSNYGIYLRIPKQSSHSVQIGRQWFIDNGCQCQYFLATPTTEQTAPFTETEVVGSTEEFIDYEVAQGNRDVAIPVGTETDYIKKWT